MTWLLVIALVIGGALGILFAFARIWSDKALESEKQEMEARLGAFPGFAASQEYVGVDGSTGIAVDEQRGQLCLISRREGQLSRRVVPRQDILAVEVFEDGESVTRTVRSSQILSALVGKWFYGDVGTVIGGLSGKTRTEGRVSQIDLRLVVNDTAVPLHDVRFLSEDVPQGGFRYTEAMNKARHWAGIVKVLIERADTEERAREVAEVAGRIAVREETARRAIEGGGKAEGPARRAVEGGGTAGERAPDGGGDAEEPSTEGGDDAEQRGVEEHEAQQFGVEERPAEQRNAEAYDKPRQSPTGSIADELQKLAALHTGGALSDDEFREAKARLLEPPVR